jgi:intracellular sulfur oxidation DsrE/DsrF family protein
METQRKKLIIVSLMALLLVWATLSFASSDTYDAMKGVNSVNVFFDMRDGNPQSAVIHLNLILDTYKDLVAMKKKPVFVVVFMGSAVKLISSDQNGFSAEDQKSLKEIAGIVSRMSETGIRTEVCLFAAKVFRVEPASILPKFERLENGWISEIGYQARGYSLVPVY